MPELPEVEIVRQSLEKKVRDKIIQKVLIKNRNLRFKIQSNFQKHLLKKKIKKIDRFSKYIIITFEDSSGFIIHLGMSGTIHLLRKNQKNIYTNSSFYNSPLLPKKHNHIEIEFEKIKIIYNDPRRFGFIKLIKGYINLKNYFNKLGPDPFEENFNFEYVKKYLYKKSKNIKNTLIDQKFISGIGNIYASEILNYSKINPFKFSGRIKNNEINKIILISHSYGGLLTSWFYDKWIHDIPMEIHAIATPLAGMQIVNNLCGYEPPNKIVGNVSVNQWITKKELDNAFKDLKIDPQIINLNKNKTNPLPTKYKNRRLGHNWSISYVADQIRMNHKDMKK